MTAPLTTFEPAPVAARSRRVLLGGILVLAAAVRWWGIGFGIPHPECRPDETVVATIALSFFTAPDFNPHFFKYPTLHMYALHLVYWAVYYGGRLTGSFESLAQFLALWASDVGPFLIVSRSFSALLSTLTALVLYATGSQLLGARTGLLSAFYLSLAFLAVREAHFGVTDSALTLLIVLCSHFLIRSHRDQSRRDFLVAAVLAGLAMATKYNALLLWAPALAVVGATHLRRDQPVPFGEAARRLAAFVGTCLLVFLVATPYSVLHYRKFVDDVLFEASHLRDGHAIDLGRGWLWHASFSLPQAVGMPLLVAAGLGVALLGRRDPRLAAILCSFPLGYYLAVGSGSTVFIRYMLPVVPFVALAAAVSTTGLAGWLGRRFGTGRTEGVLAMALGILIAWPSARKVVAFDRLLATTDNRLIASSWTALNIPAGATIYQGGAVYGHVFRPVHERWRFDNEARRFLTEAGPTEARPDWIVMQESPLRHYSEAPGWIGRLLAREYVLAKEFKAIDLDRADNVYDQQDAFYVPLDGFKGIERPGPNLYVYKRRARPES